MGETLARIHSVRGEYNGFEKDGFWGPLFHDNKPTQNWIDFFRERRLIPMLKLAADSGFISHTLVSRIEKIIPYLSELDTCNVAPSLLHGDAQQNNFISTAKGTYVIDPAIFYGNPEYDLALIDSWQPVPEDFFNGYRNILPIDPGFFERRFLWRIPLCIAAVALEGKMHLKRLTDAVEKYL
jgi:fructosamine-3-kinase